MFSEPSGKSKLSALVRSLYPLWRHAKRPGIVQAGLFSGFIGS
jgi:hypothetical protein